jgi:hypothetical protein
MSRFRESGVCEINARPTAHEDMDILLLCGKRALRSSVHAQPWPSPPPFYVQCWLFIASIGMRNKRPPAWNASQAFIYINIEHEGEGRYMMAFHARLSLLVDLHSQTLGLSILQRRAFISQTPGWDHQHQTL